MRRAPRCLIPGESEAGHGLTHTLHALGLENDARVRGALDTLEKCLVVGAFRAWLPRLAARQPPIDVGTLVAGTPG